MISPGLGSVQVKFCQVIRLSDTTRECVQPGHIPLFTETENRFRIAS